jgi:4-hydroxyphenylpyruvate dioxygenase
MGTATLTAPEQVTDTFPINGTDFIEFYVGNAKQAAHFYRKLFGYRIRPIAPETGARPRQLRQQQGGPHHSDDGAAPDSDIATTCTSMATA